MLQELTSCCCAKRGLLLLSCYGERDVLCRSVLLCKSKVENAKLWESREPVVTIKGRGESPCAEQSHGKAGMTSEIVSGTCSKQQNASLWMFKEFKGKKKKKKPTRNNQLNCYKCVFPFCEVCPQGRVAPLTAAPSENPPAFLSVIRSHRHSADFLQLLELAMPKNGCFAAFSISFLSFVYI